MRMGDVFAMPGEATTVPFLSRLLNSCSIPLFPHTQSAIIEILSGSVEFLEKVPQRPNDKEMLEPLKQLCLKEIPGLEPFLNGQTKVRKGRKCL